MKKTGIYKITNKLNGQAYVGQSVYIKRRWTNHKSEALNKNSKRYNSAICRAIRKYGIENFDFEILEECNQNELNIKEIYWISYYNTYHNGYNETLGGDTGLKAPNGKILGIFYDLETTKLSHSEIAKKWNISIEMVDGINTGRHWKQKDKSYPIRKSITKKYYCISCGKKVCRNAKYCKTCYENQFIRNSISKEELSELIISFPFTQIAKMYGVSDNAVRKWCKHFGLPYKFKDIKHLKENI